MRNHLKRSAAILLLPLLIILLYALYRENHTTAVPVLLYHHFAETAEIDTVVSAQQFRQQMAALRDSGFTAITLEQMLDYVDHGTPLPEKPVLITMDDGYTSNLTIAAPILEEYGVTVMPEPLNVKVNHPGYYLTSAEEAFAIVREVDSPYVKIIYDIYHQQITEGDIIPTVTNNLELIAHLHAAGHPGRHDLWEGELNYKYIFDAIDRAGYTGACGLEYGSLGDPVKSLAEAMRLFG